MKSVLPTTEELAEIPPALLLAVNVIPLIGVAWLGWDVRGLLTLYWSENLIIGAFTIVKMLARSPIGGLFTAAFFSLHYGGFCAVHGIFVLAMTSGGLEASVPEGLMPEGDGSWPFLLIFFELLYRVTRAVFDLATPMWLIAFGALVLSHGSSLVANFFVRGESDGTDVKNLMASPYGRIVLLHITLIAGGFGVIALGSPLFLLLMLVVLKTAVDLIFHLREHRKLRQKVAKRSVPGGVVAATVAVLLFVGCTGSRVLTELPEPSPDCIVVAARSSDFAAESYSARDTLALYASRPEISRSLSGKPLVIRGCTDTPSAGLATAWSINDDSTVATFRLRSGLDAHAIAATLAAAANVDSAGAVGDREITIHVPRSTLSAIINHESSIINYWSSFIIPHPEFRTLDPPLDERDLIDRGVDVLVTRSPDVIDYARRAADAAVVALPWDRVYVLLAREPINVPADLRTSLVSGAVRAESRVTSRFCHPQERARPGDRPEGEAPHVPLLNAVVYDSSDDVASDIAERIVSLSTGINPDAIRFPLQAVTALPASADEVSSRVQAGRETLYVVSVPRVEPDVCDALRAAFGGAVWIEPTNVTPLVETRDHVYVGRPDVTIAVDAFGYPYVIRDQQERRP